jgi:pimeloyl-ACP methyl ester carboxylesterase
LDVALPFYGDTLDAFARAYDLPLTTDIKTRGGAFDEEFLAFEAEVAEALRAKAGVSEAAVDAEYGHNPKPRGPQNWEWVQAILRALDRNFGGLGQAALETFVRDTFLYTRRAGVRDEIDRIVARALDERPAVVVGHSLGSVVAYNVLRRDPRRLEVPLYVTVGSPLGVRAIRDELRPLRFPPAVGAWRNALDERDVVALYPLDGANFPVTPAIENHTRVRNHTANRHSIGGYLDDPGTVGWILDALAG